MRRASVKNLLASYPRVRPPLPPAHQAIFEEAYKINRQGKGVAEYAAIKLEEWMHRRVVSTGESPVLELGAGTLNHLQFENHIEDYIAIEPFEVLWQGSPQLDKVTRILSSVSDLPEEPRFRRIISVAVLEHMTDLPREVAEAGLRLARDGSFHAGIPNEGGLLWYLAWRFITGTAFWFRYKLDYGYLMRHEHVNSAADIEAVLNYFFTDVRRKRFPTPLKHLSFYCYLEARHPNLERCREYLET